MGSGLEPYAASNGFLRLTAVQLSELLYSARPAQGAPQSELERIRSQLPVSKSTIQCQTASILNKDKKSKQGRYTPVKFLGGVPTEMVPYHKESFKLVNMTLPVRVSRFPKLDSDVSMPLERGCGSPVFLSYAIIPL